MTRSGPEFGPRPEATALKWDELLDTNRDATEELITWLSSAASKNLSKDVEKAPGDGTRDIEHDEQLATSVLISGDRGFGKTTVLMTAYYALRNPDGFLGIKASQESSATQQPRQEARSPEQLRIKELHTQLNVLNKQLHWLTPLDLEPLPPKANLLATLLVRVRDALDRGRLREDRRAAPSLLEEGINDPYGKINKLLQDATFMWEDLPTEGQDPRQRAAHLIKAAEIYSTFRHDFFEAMEAASRLLAQRRFGHGSQEKVMLVLPIDNVDRSTQHLEHILKLTRMVASRHLCFVLAAGHQEFQLFLERAFQRELTSGGQAALGPQNLEDALSIARRQASTAMHRVLPSVHRIQIAPVTPEHVWRFRAAPPLSGNARDQQELWSLLQRLPLPCVHRRPDGLTTFADLFDIKKRILGRNLEGRYEGQSVKDELDEISREERSEAEGPGTKAAPAESGNAGGQGIPVDIALRIRELSGTMSREVLLEMIGRIESGEAAPAQEDRSEPIFSYPARIALTLSARSALDLWQAAEVRCRQLERHRKQTSGHDGRLNDSCWELSIDLAETMLRSAIDESDLPGWASEQILNRIMRHDAQRRLVLDLTHKPIRPQKVTTLADVLQWPTQALDTPDGGTCEDGSELLATELHLRHLRDDILELHDLDRGDHKVPLPPAVAGWFMLLHDLLVLTREKRVLDGSVMPHDTAPAMAVTLQTARLALKEPVGAVPFAISFWWLPPTWDTFIDFSILTTQWRAFLHRIQNLFNAPRDQAVREDERFAAPRFSFVMAAWIDSICSVARRGRGGWDWSLLDEVVPFRKSRGVQPEPQETEPTREFNEASLPAYLEAVTERVNRLFDATRRESTYGRDQIAQLWIDQTLPLLLHAEFLPRGCLRFQLGQGDGKPSVQVQDLLRKIRPWAEGRWEQRHPLVDASLFELVRKMVEESEAFQRVQDSLRGQQYAFQLYSLSQEACRQWLSLVPDPAGLGVPG